MKLVEAMALTRLMALKGIGPVSANRILRDCADLGLELSRITHKSEIPVPLVQYLTEEMIEKFLEADDQFDEQAQQIEDKHIGFLSTADVDYPKSLLEVFKDSAPPILSYAGNLNLLKNQSVGFCGSRNASAKGILVAQDCSTQLARQGVVIVSGGARGVDHAAHKTALEAGGQTIVVLAEGILRFRARKDLESIWDWERVLLLSQFPPDRTWSGYQAMRRNDTIIGLSNVMVVIEAGRNGGTMDAGRKTLKYNRPLFAAVYEPMPETAIGNEILLRAGAQRLKRSRTSGNAAMHKMLETLNVLTARNVDNSRQDQLSMALHDA